MNNNIKNLNNITILLFLFHFYIDLFIILFKEYNIRNVCINMIKGLKE